MYCSQPLALKVLQHERHPDAGHLGPKVPQESKLLLLNHLELELFFVAFFVWF